MSADKKLLEAAENMAASIATAADDDWAGFDDDQPGWEREFLRVAAKLRAVLKEEVAR